MVQMSQKEQDIQMMLAAGCHLGTKNVNFQMERYGAFVLLFFVVVVSFDDDDDDDDVSFGSREALYERGKWREEKISLDAEGWTRRFEERFEGGNVFDSYFCAN